MDPAYEPDAISALAGDDSFLASIVALEDLLSQQLESGEVTPEGYDDAMKIAGEMRDRTLMNAPHSEPGKE